MKFKPGDKVWDVRYGAVELDEYISIAYPFVSKESGLCYTVDGKDHLNSKYPVLYTLEEARKMGFPVPPEKKKKVKRWLYGYVKGFKWRNTEDFYTEKEAEKHWIKLPWSEMEFDE